MITSGLLPGCDVLYPGASCSIAAQLRGCGIPFDPGDQSDFGSGFKNITTGVWFLVRGRGILVGCGFLCDLRLFLKCVLRKKKEGSDTAGRRQKYWFSKDAKSDYLQGMSVQHTFQCMLLQLARLSAGKSVYVVGFL